MRSLCVLFLLATISATAQTGTARARSTVTATGQATVSATPDQARIDVSAVTVASSAQEAASENAGVAANIITQVKKALGASGTVQTVNYSVSPNYNNSATLTGYTVTNTIEIVLNDLTLIGTVIDTATQAGASRINTLQFTLKDDSGPRSQALQMATIQARAKAEAMATSVGLKTGAILAIQESGAAVQPVTAIALAGAAATPVIPGQVSVAGNVTIEVELIQ